VPDPANPQSLNRYSYCLNNPLRYNDPTGNWPNWGSIGQFFKGIGESFLGTLESAFPPYQLYTEVIEPISKIASGQATYQDFQTTPAQTWEGIKSYYDFSTPLGWGHFTGTVAVTVASTVAGVAGSSGSASVVAGSSKAGVSTTSSKALIPWVDPAGRPPNLGAIGTWTEETLAPRTIISRVGQESGTFASPKGTPLQMRSLPLGSQGMSETTYEVVSAFTVQKSITAPWYNQFGFGTQYRLPAPVKQLIAEGYLK
jgi:hypothetical protein